MTLWEAFFGLDGRIGRGALWLSGLAIVLIDLAAVLVAGSAAPRSLSGMISPLGAGLAILAALSVWIGLALKVKRCHDRGHSGWRLLLALIPVIGWGWLLIDLGFLPGTPGPNRFGESPRGDAGPGATPVLAEFSLRPAPRPHPPSVAELPPVIDSPPGLVLWSRMMGLGEGEAESLPIDETAP